MRRRSPTGIAPVLQVHPSRLCNLACAHCYSSSGPRVREELEWELLSRCLEDAAELGYGQLAVSGGEPLLYRSLAALLRRARELGMLTSVTSNGMLLKPERWEPLAGLVDVLAISIDGRPSEHDRLRGRDGAFDATVAGFEIVRASGVPFGLLFTLTQHNVDSLEFVVRLAARHGARGVQVHPLTLDGRAGVALRGSRPDGVELVTALLEAERLGETFGVAVQVDAVTAAQLVAYRDHFVPERPVARLIDIAPALVVASDGTVVPMTHEVSRDMQLGLLSDAGLLALSHRWMARGGADALADACERTWVELANGGAPAVYWYDEVAARTQCPAGVVGERLLAARASGVG